jgi:hypothetical protein
VEPFLPKLSVVISIPESYCTGALGATQRQSLVPNGLMIKLNRVPSAAKVATSTGAGITKINREYNL